jgi:hypothetical protein
MSGPAHQPPPPPKTNAAELTQYLPRWRAAGATGLGQCTEPDEAAMCKNQKLFKWTEDHDDHYSAAFWKRFARQIDRCPEG